MNQLDLYDHAEKQELTPTDKNVHRDEIPRLSKQNRVVLDRLRQGFTNNRDLSKIALSYTRRICDLRDHGYVIEARRDDFVSGRVLYCLMSGPGVPTRAECRVLRGRG